jgi:hypothetical protein
MQAKKAIDNKDQCGDKIIIASSQHSLTVDSRKMKVLLAFKNPSRPLNDTFELECSVVTSIGELKQTLQGVYPGNPLPEAITVSF